MVDGGGEETEVATADFTWVLYVPGEEVGLSAPPSDKGTEGREGGGITGEEKEESCPTAAFINMRTCSLWRYSEANRCLPFTHKHSYAQLHAPTQAPIQT